MWLTVSDEIERLLKIMIKKLFCYWTAKMPKDFQGVVVVMSYRRSLGVPWFDEQKE